MELYIPEHIVIGGRNPVNGQFMRGYVPTNKGRSWDEWLPKKSQRRCRRGWKNLDKYRCKGHPNAGRPRLPVVLVRDDGTFTIFPYLNCCAEALGGNEPNVRRCCVLNGSLVVNKKTGRVNSDHKYMGVRLYYEKDTDIWMSKIK